ncbi:MAG: hypothetical protein ACRC6V_18795 [Bacteroidales bacterium]
MKKLFILFSLLSSLSLSAITLSTQADVQSTSTESSSNNSITVDQMMEQCDALVGQSVSLKGNCTHRCKHGGGKMFVAGANGQILRIQSTSQSGRFPVEVVGKEVTVQGTLMEERIDEEYLVKWEKRMEQEMAAHGESEGGCSTEKKARNESTKVQTPQERIESYRARIAERFKSEGKNYLSFYFIKAEKYTL